MNSASVITTTTTSGLYDNGVTGRRGNSAYAVGIMHSVNSSNDGSLSTTAVLITSVTMVVSRLGETMKGYDAE